MTPLPSCYFDYARYRSEIINDDDTPMWAPVDVMVDELGGFDAPFAIKCFNWDKGGDHFRILRLLFFLLSVIPLMQQICW